jgi:hypothetical protein
MLSYRTAYTPLHNTSCLPFALSSALPSIFLPTIHPLEKMLNLTTFNTLVPEPQN